MLPKKNKEKTLWKKWGGLRNNWTILVPFGWNWRLLRNWSINNKNVQLRQFVLNIWVFVLFCCWLFGNVLASSLRHLQSATSFIPATCSEPAKLHTESVPACDTFWDFNVRKMASQFLSKNGREDSVNFGLFRVVFECSVSMFEAFWMFLRRKKYSKFWMS